MKKWGPGNRVHRRVKAQTFGTLFWRLCQNTEWYLRLGPVQMPFGKPEASSGQTNKQTQAFWNLRFSTRKPPRGQIFFQKSGCLMKLRSRSIHVARDNTDHGNQNSKKSEKLKKIVFLCIKDKFRAPTSVRGSHVQQTHNRTEYRWHA